MNRRIKKKIEKRLGAKTYYEGRRRKIIAAANKILEGIERVPNTTNIIYIEDSKKMNLKHPHQVKVFANAYPSGMSSSPPYIPNMSNKEPLYDNERVGSGRNLDINFRCEKPPIVDPAVGEILRGWVEELKSSQYDSETRKSLAN